MTDREFLTRLGTASAQRLAFDDRKRVKRLTTTQAAQKNGSERTRPRPCRGTPFPLDPNLSWMTPSAPDAQGWTRTRPRHANTKARRAYAGRAFIIGGYFLTVQRLDVSPLPVFIHRIVPEGKHRPLETPRHGRSRAAVEPPVAPLCIGLPQRAGCRLRDGGPDATKSDSDQRRGSGRVWGCLHRKKAAHRGGLGCPGGRVEKSTGRDRRRIPARTCRPDCG